MVDDGLGLPLGRVGVAVLVVAAPPEATLVTAQWRSVEPLVHAPQAIQSALVRRVGVVDDAVLEREHAQAFGVRVNST